jgi:SAM-dependent methyltransferase
MDGMTTIALAKTTLRNFGQDPQTLYHRLSAASIDAAAAEQGLLELRDRLRAILPDVTDQYTLELDAEEYGRYWERKMRTLQAFQVRCVLDALAEVGRQGMVVADIGDSSGNHAAYIKALAPAGTIGRFISVNLDPVAVEKVRRKGGEAVLCRAEELDLQNIRPDLFLSFQMVEHLTDPLRFMHALAEKGSADHVLFSVPYRRSSRFGGGHLRMPEQRMPASMTPEEVHMFELSAADWALLVRVAGYRVRWQRVYRQYPRHGWLRMTQPLWGRYDFEGFLTLFLERDLSLARRYTGW